MKLKEIDREELYKAMLILENPGIAAKITNFIGTPIEKSIELLPENWRDKVGEITKTALLKATDAAVLTLKDNNKNRSSNMLHKIGVAFSGGVGGFFGLPALAIELPVSTTLMLRSIADIARAEGESINNPDTKLACIEVFALGGRGAADDAVESGYFTVRAALAKSVSEAAEFAATKVLTDEGAPVLIRLISNIAERFSVQVTEKAAAQSIPAIGAAGGAILNTIFIDHFQDMAKGHFIIRRLENQYGKDLIKSAYDDMLKRSLVA
ncbi:EcsC family protein [Joostella atrarenae]|uniref:EcsC family protein n=1 Tax=Joostella atrarenae TaxID=679257 RepID=A0ABS9J4J1_9FLAO|nr:EcsC family protein [Joostella atrarenae]MCF8715345.1 EcsC family protein [Joostella atrarenae]